jgi:hypothetical protein
MADGTHRMNWLLPCVICMLCCPLPLSAQSAARTQRALLPADPSCALLDAPADAGAVVTPGGFLLVHPRNAQLPARYSGCKTLWIMDTEPAARRWSTLWFREGRLQRAVLWQRDAPQDVDRVCDMPGGTPPGATAAEPCTGVEGNELMGLLLPSWPRACTVDTTLAACAGAPE